MTIGRNPITLGETRGAFTTRQHHYRIWWEVLSWERGWHLGLRATAEDVVFQSDQSLPHLLALLVRVLHLPAVGRQLQPAPLFGHFEPDGHPGGAQLPAPGPVLHVRREGALELQNLDARRDGAFAHPQAAERLDGARRRPLGLAPVVVVLGQGE